MILSMNKLFILIRSELSEIEFVHNWPAFIFAIIGLLPVIGHVPPTTLIFYSFLIVLFFWILKNQKEYIHVCGLFIVACIVSICIASPPAFFRVWERLGLFTLVFVVGSPLFQGEVIRKFRYQSLYVMMKLCVVISVVSFVFYFLGINYFEVNEEALDVSMVGGFGGLTKHSMLLGPISCFALIYTSYKALSTKNRWYWILAVCSAACTMFATSRGAFLAGIIGNVAMLYVFAQKRSQFYKILGTILILGAVTFPLWNSALEGLENKQIGNVEAGSITDSRNKKWMNRIEEFETNPLTGVGFCACDIKCSDYSPYTGTIEGGSSWLIILSMTGLLGFIPFCVLIIRCIKHTFYHRTKESALLMGLLSALLFHFISESYILAGGSQLCFIAWMVIGCCYDNIYRPKIN